MKSSRKEVEKYKTLSQCDASSSFTSTTYGQQLEYHLLEEST